jgi:hypothetical protein
MVNHAALVSSTLMAASAFLRLGDDLGTNRKANLSAPWFFKLTLLCASRLICLGTCTTRVRRPIAVHLLHHAKRVV